MIRGCVFLVPHDETANFSIVEGGEDLKGRLVFFSLYRKYGSFDYAGDAKSPGKSSIVQTSRNVRLLTLFIVALMCFGEWSTQVLQKSAIMIYQVLSTLKR